MQKIKKFTKQDLINFEKQVVEEWKKGETYAPVHLVGGNEEQLLKIFEKIKPNDWVFSTHRSHFHALLKSKDSKWLMNEIIVKANSSHINSQKYRVFTSAIVGGNIPIALGVALAIKRKRHRQHVWCFVGDMAAEMGCFWEAEKFANGMNLPITFVVEDNTIGCNTPTNIVWGKQTRIQRPNILYYNYRRYYPHCGTGDWLQFKKKFKSTGNYDAFK